MAVDDIVRVDAVGRGPQSEAVVNTFHYRQNTGGVDVNLEAFITAFLANMQIPLTGCLTLDYILDYVEATFITGANQGIFEHTDVAAGGLKDEDPLPMQVAIVIKRQAGIKTRRGLGRIFLSPVPAAWVDINGNVDVGQTELTSIADAMLDTVSDGTVDMVPTLFHKSTSEWTDISFTGVAATAGSRRSRRVRAPN